MGSRLDTSVCQVGRTGTHRDGDAPPIGASGRRGESMRLIPGRSSLVAALAAVVVLVVASPALAVFSVSGVTATPSTTEAGGHPDLTVVVNFSGDNTQVGTPGPTSP